MRNQFKRQRSVPLIAFLLEYNPNQFVFLTPELDNYAIFPPLTSLSSALLLFCCLSLPNALILVHFYPQFLRTQTLLLAQQLEEVINISSEGRVFSCQHLFCNFFLAGIISYCLCENEAHSLFVPRYTYELLPGDQLNHTMKCMKMIKQYPNY